MMNSKLKSLIKELEKLDNVFLVKSDKNTLEKAKKVLGENMPSQLQDWFNVFNGGNIGSSLHFFSTEEKHKDDPYTYLTLKGMNDKKFKKQNQIPEELMCFARNVDTIGFDKTKKSEKIYAYYSEQDTATEYKDLVEFLEESLSICFLIEDAFERYFAKLTENYKATFNTNPTITYTNKLNKKLLISKPNADGKVEWKPLLQETKPDWKKIEKKLGFNICSELKEYYSTYLFCNLEGKIGDKELDFYPITDDKNLAKIIEQHYKDAQWEFPNSQVFLIGSAKVGRNENYNICFDNSKAKLFLYDNEMNKKVTLHSLSYCIATMEAPFKNKKKGK